MICKQCENDFKEKYSKLSNGDFCSKACARKYSRKQSKQGTKKVNCIDCGKELKVDKRASSKQCKCDDCRKQVKLVKENVCRNCNIDISNKTRQHRFCCLKCSSEYRYKQMIISWKNGTLKINTKNGKLPPAIRRYIFKKYNSKCTKCDWSKINPITNKIPLEVEHIDGNYKNNKEENLDLLCPNCHSLTPTYKALNKGNGREYRYLLK